MGPDTHGRVIFMADKPVKCATAIRYLNAEIDGRVTGRIDPTRFDEVALQLLAAGIVRSDSDCLELLKHSLSGHVAREAGKNQDLSGNTALAKPWKSLQAGSLSAAMPDLTVTNVGLAVARSALMPCTAAYFLSYFQANVNTLAELLEAAPPTTVRETEDLSLLERSNTDLSCLLFHLCYCSPEFGDNEIKARRYLPYPLGDRRESDRITRLQNYLTVRPWDRNVPAANAADISADWISVYRWRI